MKILELKSMVSERKISWDVTDVRRKSMNFEDRSTEIIQSKNQSGKKQRHRNKNKKTELNGNAKQSYMCKWNLERRE